MYINLVYLTNTNLINNIESTMTFEPELNDKSVRFAVYETATFLYNQYTEH